MKCNYSLNNNYEIIGLCDIKKFNELISEFSDNSWTQIIIPEILTLPDSNPDIESISSVNININISSSKIIKTPKSVLPNTEGLNLTGKTLLVSGCLSQSIIYTSCNSYQSVHSVKFKIPFDTYIIIDPDTDMDKDTFCVYPCIENIYIKPMTKRSFNKSITLFLFAHRIEPFNCILKNTFILNSIDNEEVVSIHFDICKKVFSVISSSIVYNPSKTTLAFLFKLYAPNGTLKIFASMNEDENADAFANKLDNTPFEIGDLMDLTFVDKDKLKLTNFPIKGQDYTMLGKNFQSFRITSKGIIENILPNIITLNNPNGLTVLQIKIDLALIGRILIYSTGERTDPAFAGQQYFKLTLFDNDGVTIKDEQEINGDEDGGAIATQFADENYSFNDVLKLEYADADKVTITKFEGNPIYKPSGTEELYTITENGLIRYVPKLANAITIQNENDQIMATIEFDKTDNRFIVQSTGAMAFSTTREEYFTLVLYDDNLDKKLESTILTNRTADSFKSAVNGFEFTPFSDILVLIYKDKEKIRITNFPNQGMPHIPLFNANIFAITDTRLEEGSIDTKIFFRNDANQEMATIQFADSRAGGLAVATKTNAISTQSLTNTEEYIQLQLIFNNAPFINMKILGRGTATNIIKLNDIIFNKARDILRIAARFPNTAVITNYKGQANYIVSEDSEFFRLQGNTIRPRPLLDYNIIKLQNNNNDYVIKIYFDTLNFRIWVDLISTNTSDLNHFIFKLLTPDESTIKGEWLIFNGEKGDIFKSSLDGIPFEYTDVIELSYTDGNLIEITDIPNIGDIYNPTGTSEKFEIANSGLVQKP